MTDKPSADLESILRYTPPNAFKSAGEQRIADFLDRHSIKYIYEPPTAVTQHGKTRLWYPDFLLPDYGLYIEYYGRTGDPDYDRGILEKTAAYEASGLEVIPIYPHHLAHAWPNHLAREIREITQYRANALAAKLGPRSSYSKAGRY